MEADYIASPTLVAPGKQVAGVVGGGGGPSQTLDTPPTKKVRA